MYDQYSGVADGYKRKPGKSEQPNYDVDVTGLMLVNCYFTLWLRSFLSLFFLHSSSCNTSLAGLVLKMRAVCINRISKHYFLSVQIISVISW